MAVEASGTMLDSAVRSAFAVSWGRARELIERGKVSIDGVVTKNPRLRVRTGMKITLDVAARRDRTGELAEEALVFVDAHIVVVDKPSGIATIPFSPEGMGASIARRPKAGEEVALDEQVRRLLARKARGRGATPPNLGVVHRLDKETSGLLVFTKTFAAKKALSTSFRFHHVHRRYLGLVHGHPSSTTFHTHFVPNRGDGLRGSVEHRGGRKTALKGEQTQEAITHVEVLERFEGKGSGVPCALVACRLETGRTHQIRIHLSEAGFPLLGEKVYVRGYTGTLVPAPRVMLHAAELGFEHPATGEALRWESPLPKDMAEMVAFLSGERAKRPR